ncbi:MAG: 50S ribosomal protein L18 [Actinomycetota bacterium]
MVKTKKELLKKHEARGRRHRRVRRRVFGTPDMPRLAVFRSNREIYAQVIDDLAGATLVSASSAEVKDSGLKKSEVAVKVGEILAGKAKEKKIGQVVFDRGGYLFHGRVRALAEGARKGGIKF